MVYKMNFFYLKRKIKVKSFFLLQDFKYFFSDIHDKIDNVFISNPRWFFKRIKHLIYWIPIIWKDYWFDDYYILIILKHKLKDMAINFKENGMTVESSTIAKEIDELIRLIDLYHYEDNEIYGNEVEKIYGKDIDPFSTKRVKQGYRSLVSKNRDEKYFEDLRNFMDLNEKRKKILIDRIYKTLAENNGYWWD